MVLAILFMGVSVGVASMLPHLAVPAGVRYTLPIGCVVLGIAYFWAMFRDFRSSTDELQRRINLEAAVGACAGVYVAMVVYPVFQKAGVLGALDPLAVLLLLIGLYMGGYVVAKWRYR